MPLLPPKTKPDKPQSSVWKMNISDIILPGRKLTPSGAELALLCRKLSYLLGSGLSLKASFPILQGQSLGATLSRLLPKIHNLVLKGDSFADALKQTANFPEFMLGYVAIGEKTAQLAKVCERLADFYEEQTQARRELVASFMYPSVVLLMMLGVIILSMVTVLPGYARIFEASNVSLPAITQLLIDISAFMADNAIWVAICLVAVVALVIFLAKNKKLLAFLQLKIPLMRLGINLNLAQALSILLSSGIKIEAAVNLCTDIMDNVRVKKDLKALAANLAGGMEFAEALETINYIDPLLCDMARIGEKTAGLETAMTKCHSYFAADYKHGLKRANKLIEPIVTLTMGILLAFIMLAVVLPTFELATAF